MKEFEEGTIVQKVKMVEEVLDKEIRFFLQHDGGDYEVTDIKEEDDNIVIYMNYMGACNSCGGIQGTVSAIQSILQNHLSDKIIVKLS